MYLDILKSSLSESVNKLGVSGNWYFQQDNDTVPKQLHSPLQLPDQIEHFWDELERHQGKKNKEQSNKGRNYKKKNG